MRSESAGTERQRASAKEAVRVAIAGGSTHGHAAIGLAIAQGLESVAPGTEVTFCGSRGGVEMSVAEKAGLRTASVPALGLLRERSARAALRNLAIVPAVNLAGTLAARAVLRRLRPQVVIGVGAFASLPWVLAARWLRTPVVLHEANARPGVANRVLSRFADLSCLSDRGALGRIEGRNVEVTGTPVYVPAANTELGGSAARLAFGLEPDRPTLLVLGGTLGSPLLNAWMAGAASELQGHGVQVLWQTGPSHYRSAMDRVSATRGLRAAPFFSNVHDAYRAADLVVSAAGASTVAELLHFGLPAVLVPTAGVADDHQLETARHAAEKGWLVCLPDDVATLLPEVLGLLADATRRLELLRKRERNPEPNPAETIARRAIELANRGEIA